MADGEDQGDDSDEVGGVIGGVDLAGVDSWQGFTSVHISQLRVRRTTVARYPRAARALNLGEVTCRYRVSIDPDGEPTRLAHQACPAAFHDAAEEALWATRWYPHRVNRQKVAVTTVLNVVFRP